MGKTSLVNEVITDLQNRKEVKRIPIELSLAQDDLKDIDVLKLIPVAESTWWAGVAKGTFPKPVKLGPKITAWKIEDIKDFIDSFSSE